MTTPRYRILVSYDTEQQIFRARAPELEHCFGEGPTRAEAIAKLEQELDAQVRNLQDQGKQAPKALDEQTWTGELAVQVSRTLHRDLVWQARTEGTELQQLLAEIIASGMEARRSSQRGSRPQPRDGNRVGGNTGEAPSGNGNREWGSRGRNYNGLLDDRAQFIQYVRNTNSEQRPSSSYDKNKQQPRNDRRPMNKRPHQRRRPEGTRPEGAPRAEAASQKMPDTAAPDKNPSAES